MSKYKRPWEKKYYIPVSFVLFDSPETKKQWNAQRKRQEVIVHPQLKGNQ
jgi:hypothetical protein